jgi:hypothetical protein
LKDHEKDLDDSFEDAAILNDVFVPEFEKGIQELDAECTRVIKSCETRKVNLRNAIIHHS